MNKIRKKTRSLTFSGSLSRAPLGGYLWLVMALIMGLMPYASAVHAEEIKLARQAVTATKALSLGQADQMAQAAKAFSLIKPAKAGLLAKHAQAVKLAKRGNGLEVGDEIVPVGVRSVEVKAPTVNPVFYDATTISGDNLAKARVNKQIVIATVHVTLKGEDGTVKATLSDAPTKGTAWKVGLPGGVKVAKGDTVTVYQQIGEDKSLEVTAKAQASKASTVTLTMPTGEIWIEQTSSNIVNDDEQAEAIEMLKNANTDIVNDFKAVKFSIEGTDHAYYEVTYSDGSTSGKIAAMDLKIKTVTAKSAAPTIHKVQVTDGQIIVTLEKKVAEGTKFYFVKNIDKNEYNNFCDGGNCKVDKSDSQEMSQVVIVNGTTVTFPIKDKVNDLKLGKEFGIVVKEPHKFRSCAKSEPVITTPSKVAVRDPHKLTDADKKAIDKAIRDANTVNGTSKLPDGNPGTNWEGIPAAIQFDGSGNVKIFSATDVEVTYDSNYNPVPVKNADGSVKLIDGAEPKGTIPAKDLLKNIKPGKPALKVENGNVIITPDKVDTDAKTIAVSYKDKDGNDQTTTATKANDGTWSISKGEGSVDQNGVVSLPKDKVKGGTTVTATVTDKGGVADDDKTPLESDPGTLTVEETKADKVEALGGLDPVVLKKWVKDTIDWKDGVKAKDSTKETEVNKLLAGSTFTDETETKRSTDKSGDFEGKVKVKFSDGSEIIVEKQMLYVSDPVSPSDKENLPEDALDVELKLGEGVKAGEIEGNKETPVTAKTYKVKPGTDLSTEKVSKTEKTCFEDVGAELKDDTYVGLVWNDKDKVTNFKASAENNVFTATATKIFKVTVVRNGGTGDDKVETKKSGEKYTLPKGDTFTPPENKEFAGWLVGDATTTTAPGTEIIITSDTVIKASWKPIMVDVSFDKGEGSGSKDKVSVAKGSEYTLPNSEGFTPPENKEFDGWEVNGEAKKVGDKITVTDNTTVIAKYKPIMVDVSFDKGEGSGNKDKVSVAKGSEYTLPNSEGFTPPENKEFDGWEVNGEAKKVGDKITVTDNTTVIAKYKPIMEMVDVSFDKGEGSGEKDKVSVAKGSEYTLPNSEGFTPPANQAFAGWEVNGETKNVGDKITVTENTTVTAKYKPIMEMVDVSFNKGEGSGEKDKVSVAKGSEYTLPDSEGFTPPENKEFDGWEVNGEAKKVGDKITVTDNTTVIAKYKPIMVDVSFDKGEGSGNKDKVSVAKGSEYTLPNSEGFTPPENKEFDGWEVNGEAKKVGDKITVTDNTTVTAKYKPIMVMVDVSFDKGEGSGSKDKVSVAKGSEYTLPNSEGFTPPENKEFDGWEVNGEAKKVGDKITVTENTTVIAKYKPIMVDVNFDKGEGSGSKDKVSVAKGSEYTLPNSEGFTPPENKEFDGWEVNGEAKKVGDKITVTDNTTVTAKYKPIMEMVDVSFDKGEGSGEKDKVSVAKGSEYTLPNSEGFTPPENKEFDGWEVNGEAKKVGDKITVTDNTTVIAKYKPIMVDVNFEPGAGSGTMNKETVKKGSTFKLPLSKFAAPKNMEFKCWKVGDTDYAPGAEIAVDNDTVIIAIWKDKSSDPGSNPGNEPGTEPGTEPGNEPGTDPGTKPGKDPGKDPSTPPVNPGSDSGKNPTKPGNNPPMPDSKDQEYKVTFIINGSEEGTQLVTKGGLIDKDKLPTKEGYTLKWYRDEACTEEYDLTKGVESDLTLYAKWSKDSNDPDKDPSTKHPSTDGQVPPYRLGTGTGWLNTPGTPPQNSLVVTGTALQSPPGQPTTFTFPPYTPTAPNQIWNQPGGQNVTANNVKPLHAVPETGEDGRPVVYALTLLAMAAGLLILRKKLQ